jgi:hypothetical protein
MIHISGNEDFKVFNTVIIISYAAAAAAAANNNNNNPVQKMRWLHANSLTRRMLRRCKNGKCSRQKDKTLKQGTL